MVSSSALGTNMNGRCDVPADLGPVLAVSAGSSCTYAVRADGQLVCFGFKIDGESECDVPADLGPVLAVSAGDLSYLCNTDQMVSSSALDTIVLGSVTSQQIWDQFWQSQQAIFTLVPRGQMVSSFALDTMGLVSVTPQLFGTSLVGHCHTCAAQRGQIVSLRALETSFTGRVMCPTADRE